MADLPGPFSSGDAHALTWGAGVLWQPANVESPWGDHGGTIGYLLHMTCMWLEGYNKMLLTADLAIDDDRICSLGIHLTEPDSGM